MVVHRGVSRAIGVIQLFGRNHWFSEVIVAEFGGADGRIQHLIQRSAGVSRTEIATELGLPPPTVTSAIRRLLSAGGVVEREGAGARSVAGRRPRMLYPAGPKPMLGVVVWSRTELQLTVADYSGAVHHQQTMATPSDTDDPRMFADVVGELAKAARTLRPRCVLTSVVISVPAPFQQGVGSPGQRLPTRRRNRPAAPLRQAGNPTFFGMLAEDPAPALSARFGLDVYLENNANLAALGEFSAGAGRGQADQMFLLLNGRGIGSGLIIGGRLMRGATGYAGELAHVQIDDDGPLCACGGRGCLSNRLGRQLLDSVQPAYAQSVTYVDLLAMAARGDAGPARILADVGRVVGRTLADVCTVLNPGLIVVDGTLGDAAHLVIDGLREQIERFTPPVIGSSIDVIAGELTDNAVVHGAIHLARVGR
jgi:predicted NBD/HSP70 family sugar kinase